MAALPPIVLKLDKGKQEAKLIAAFANSLTGGVFAVRPKKDTQTEFIQNIMKSIQPHFEEGFLRFVPLTRLHEKADHATIVVGYDALPTAVVLTVLPLPLGHIAMLKSNLPEQRMASHPVTHTTLSQLCRSLAAIEISALLVPPPPVQVTRTRDAIPVGSMPFAMDGLNESAWFEMKLPAQGCFTSTQLTQYISAKFEESLLNAFSRSPRFGVDVCVGAHDKFGAFGVCLRQTADVDDAMDKVAAGLATSICARIFPSLAPENAIEVRLTEVHGTAPTDWTEPIALSARVCPNIALLSKSGERFTNDRLALLTLFRGSVCITVDMLSGDNSDVSDEDTFIICDRQTLDRLRQGPTSEFTGPHWLQPFIFNHEQQDHWVLAKHCDLELESYSRRVLAMASITNLPAGVVFLPRAVTIPYAKSQVAYEANFGALGAWLRVHSGAVLSPMAVDALTSSLFLRVCIGSPAEQALTSLHAALGTDVHSSLLPFHSTLEHCAVSDNLPESFRLRPTQPRCAVISHLALKDLTFFMREDAAKTGCKPMYAIVVLLPASLLPMSKDEQLPKRDRDPLRTSLDDIIAMLKDCNQYVRAEIVDIRLEVTPITAVGVSGAQLHQTARDDLCLVTGGLRRHDDEFLVQLWCEAPRSSSRSGLLSAAMVEVAGRQWMQRQLAGPPPWELVADGIIVSTKQTRDAMKRIRRQLHMAAPVDPVWTLCLRKILSGSGATAMARTIAYKLHCEGDAAVFWVHSKPTADQLRVVLRRNSKVVFVFDELTMPPHFLRGHVPGRAVDMQCIPCDHCLC
eukprot:m.251179 g.251179  ORF g.251179 m.251179 type:complete len:798 (+) comp17101_c0_seq1:48-2441(+)